MKIQIKILENIELSRLEKLKSLNPHATIGGVVELELNDLVGFIIKVNGTWENIYTSRDSAIGECAIIDTYTQKLTLTETVAHLKGLIG